MRMGIISVVLVAMLSAASPAIGDEPVAATRPAASQPAATKPATTQRAVADFLPAAKTFTAKDLPEPEPGKPAWAQGNQWSYGVAVYDKWVYAASTAEYILQFERDPTTAGLKYLGAVSFNHHDPEQGVGVDLAIRRLADGDVLLYLRAGSHGPPLSQWYAVDKKTGKLTWMGKQLPAKLGVGALTPDQNRGYQMVSDTTLVWCRFEADGAPVEEGRTETHETNHHGPLVLSPDGRHLYMINGATGRVDAYGCDAKTGKATFISSLDLQADLQLPSGLMPLSPDGRHLFVFNGGFSDKGTNDKFCILGRDVDRGTLTVLASGKSESALNGQGGPTWCRGGRFAFTADGKSGCFLTLQGYYHRPAVLGTFTRDAATGALTVVSSASARALGASRFALDPVNGDLFTVGPTISSFKTPAADKAVKP